MMQITDTIILNERDIEERFVRAAGPGGQNLRKVPTAVELRFDIGKSSLPADVKRRLIALAGKHMTTGGILVVVSRVHRSQVKNRAAARDRFSALVARAAKPPARRVPTEARPAVRESRLVSKKRQGAVKRSRSRPDED